MPQLAPLNWLFLYFMFWVVMIALIALVWWRSGEKNKCLLTLDSKKNNWTWW